MTNSEGERSKVKVCKRLHAWGGAFVSFHSIRRFDEVNETHEGRLDMQNMSFLSVNTKNNITKN